MLKAVSVQKNKDTRKLMSETKFYESYSRWDEEKERYETWNEAVTRVMNMHRNFYADKMSPELSQLIDEAESLYKLQYALGAQRALQFGGDQLLKHMMRMYNCTSSYADRPDFFQEIFYILLCGAGAGFSVQKHHIAKLPAIAERKKAAKIHVVEDSIEGWADALGVLMASYFNGGGSHPEYEGRRVYFDLNQIRPKGAMISGGFKAPGPEPLRRALDKIEHLIQDRLLNAPIPDADHLRLRPIDVYDITMFAADAVLAGGVRRSATICLFSPDDEEMLNAKTGMWWRDNPQRGRSNNSAVIVRDEIEKDEFKKIMTKIKEFGEPGFYFVDDKDFTTNPCVEIGMYPTYVHEDGTKESGWQGCNLTEINGGKCTTEQEFYKACRVGAILGTLQAGYTDFTYLGDATKKIFDKEALLGVSVTGWMNNPDVLLDDEIQKRGAEIVKEVNAQVAELIGINQAARTTCVKPSGNASVLLQTSSGIHAEHAPNYIRHIQMNKESEVAQLIAETNPYMIEESVNSSNGTDYVIAFPVISPEGSLYKDELMGVSLLEKVKHVQQNWVEAGTNPELCTHPKLRHNVSNTITVLPHQWTAVEDYVYDNRHYFAGVSFLGNTGELDYAQAPFVEVLDEKEIVQKFGVGAMFASALVADAPKAGFRDLWEAIGIAKAGQELHGELSDLRKDWLRRYNKYVNNYFDGDTENAEYCFKSVAMLYKWTKIQQNFSPIDFVSQLAEKRYTDIDTMGSSACVGGACEISF